MKGKEAAKIVRTALFKVEEAIWLLEDTPAVTVRKDLIKATWTLRSNLEHYEKNPDHKIVPYGTLNPSEIEDAEV